MLVYKPNFFRICLLINLYNTVYSITTPKYISRLWKKSEQEVISKDYQINPSSTIEINNKEGDITIKAWSQNKLLVEAVKKGTADDIKNATIYVKTSSKNTQIITRVPEKEEAAKVSYTLMVPESAIIKAKITSSGSIKIAQVQGSIEAATHQGTIEIYDSTKTVVAKSTNGTIKVKQKRFDEPHTIFLETLRGNIHLYIPRETKANLHAHTLQGRVTSEHAITLYPQTMKLNKESWERMKKEAHGTLGNGGAPITLDTTKGNITLSEY